MESFKKFWSETMEIPEARWIVAIAGLAMSVAVAYYIVKFFRDLALGGTASPESYISDFQRLRDEGKLDDEEYAQLTKAIPKQIPDKLGGNALLEKASSEKPDQETPDFEIETNHDESDTATGPDSPEPSD